MTDSEINEAVARKLGWKKFDQHYQYWIPPTIEAAHKYGDKPSHLPLYTKSVAAAWEICEYLKSSGMSVNITDEGDEWCCHLDTDENWYEVADKPIAKAICLAFLKLA